MNTHTLIRRLRVTPGILLSALLLAPLLSHAAPPIAGEVIAIRGKVTATASSSEVRPLYYEAIIHEGDTVVTGPSSYVKIRFTDDGHVYLRPNTRFVIERFANAKNQRGDKSFFSVLKGGFRFITGLIGKRNKENVRFKTPVATIGIRGTDFKTRICMGDCMDLPSTSRGTKVRDGLYVSTVSGATIVNDQIIGAGVSAFTDTEKFETVLLTDLPIIMQGEPMPNPRRREVPKETRPILPSPTNASQPILEADVEVTEDGTAVGIAIPGMPTGGTQDIKCD